MPEPLSFYLCDTILVYYFILTIFIADSLVVDVGYAGNFEAGSNSMQVLCGHCGIGEE